MTYWPLVNKRQTFVRDNAGQLVGLEKTLKSIFVGGTEKMEPNHITVIIIIKTRKGKRGYFLFYKVKTLNVLRPSTQ